MTRRQLIAENEALHGLLAHACILLDEIAAWDYQDHPDQGQRFAEAAQCVLAQIQEGAVT